MKIQTLKDIKAVSQKVLEKLVKGNLCYFNIMVFEGSSCSPAYFTPLAHIRGKKASFMGVGDYEKLMMLLLSHANCEELRYNEGENSINLLFNNPFTEELESMEEPF